jgi:nucleoside-diphosphate-sugar epimerase
VAGTAFVTGATGFLGQNLVERLVAAGWSVTAFHRARARLGVIERLGVARAAGDLLVPRDVRAAMPDGVDAVFHVAADTSMWRGHRVRQERVNIEGTRNVLAASFGADAKRVVHVSTAGVYDHGHGAIDEATPQIGGKSPVGYVRTKYLAELLVRTAVERGLDAVIVNPSHIIGRYDRHNWARLIVMAATGRLPGVPPGSASFAHGQAAADALIGAAERGRRGENYLLGGAEASFLDLVREAGRLAGRRVPKRASPAALLRLAGHAGQLKGWLTGREPRVTPEGVGFAIAHIRVNSAKAERELGYNPTPFAAMVEDSFRWLEAERLIR